MNEPKPPREATPLEEHYARVMRGPFRVRIRTLPSQQTLTFELPPNLDRGEAEVFAGRMMDTDPSIAQMDLLVGTSPVELVAAWLREVRRVL